MPQWHYRSSWAKNDDSKSVLLSFLCTLKYLLLSYLGKIFEPIDTTSPIPPPYCTLCITDVVCVEGIDHQHTTKLLSGIELYMQGSFFSSRVPIPVPEPTTYCKPPGPKIPLGGERRRVMTWRPFQQGQNIVNTVNERCDNTLCLQAATAITVGFQVHIYNSWIAGAYHTCMHAEGKRASDGDLH